MSAGLCTNIKVIQLSYVVYLGSSAQKCLIYRLCLQKSHNHIKLSLQMTPLFCLTARRSSFIIPGNWFCYGRWRPLKCTAAFTLAFSLYRMKFSWWSKTSLGNQWSRPKAFLMSSCFYALALDWLFLSLSDSDIPVSGFPQCTWRQERVRWSPLTAAATRTRSRRDPKLSSVPVSLAKLQAPPGPCLPALMVRASQLAVHGFPVW